LNNGYISPFIFIQINDDGVKIAQSLSFTLGLSQDQKDASKAMVSRVSRSQMFPPQCKTLQDWFSYAFASSDLDGMVSFSVILVYYLECRLSTLEKVCGKVFN